MSLDVIIVDDDAVVLFLHKILVRKCGYPIAVRDFQQPEEALQHIASRTGNNKLLILLDINMPGLSGWEFLEVLRKMCPREKPQVAMVTSSINTADKKRALDFPEVVAFLEKPLTTEACRELLMDLQQD